ncbi:P-loop containing nucleoside triphosphate hydrolase protein [Hyaloscypha bicolor E]|uniref:P-loop containing nucleoside triphosphate hydrolase protein n=1 Tax=Hyaloscypha bicolor E TaxID=1095630 RepID=A0A2J6SRF0_9HELO|nr:P-loop containing nucleoside triphosphate hydrolase protein [Hyaloscypha bicolor E]PMD53355.1 P-loop containing nucleoside triphosphate hydrolase protein [Hyaloscypha bicolor E]
MDKTPDLVDPRQVELFDALEQLATLDVAHDIEIPQLIVVGDQSNGKSSVLEALVRSHFPVSERTCTRFPIKLILRRSNETLLKVKIEPSKDIKRSAGEEAKIQEFSRELSSWDGLANLVEEATTALGVSTRTDSKKSHSSTTNKQQNARQYTEDVLIIEKHGPHLPILSLMDLPGLFQAESPNQNKRSREIVANLVEKQVRQKKNVVLLIISAKTDVANQTVVRTFQNVLNDDKGLRDRAIGVMTHPDQAGDLFEEMQEVINNGLDALKLKHSWHVVRNQNKDEREKSESLDDRDHKEEEYFNDLAWQRVPEERKGIRNLRFTLKNAIWTCTRDALPRIILQMKEKIADIDDRVKASNESRADDSQRRRYLINMAGKFQQRTREAVQGTYENEPCKESHSVGYSCRECKGFFPVPTEGPDDPDGQKTKLCSNVRGLNMEFAMAMRRFGKAEIISRAICTVNAVNDEQSSANDSGDEPANQADRFPPQEAMIKYYTHTEPKSIDPKDYEKKVVDIIKRNRAREPIGEASSTVYRDLFLHQSARWETIATQHIRAVWEATETFINLVLKDVCVDQKVLRSLRNKIVKPNLEKLQKKANRTLKDLLDCRSLGNTGFFDSFGDVFTVQEQARDLAGRLDTFGWDDLLLERRDELVVKIRDALNILICSPVGHLSVENRIKDLIISKTFGIVKQAFSTAGKDPNEQAVRREVDKLYPAEVQHLDAARVVGIVETYYKTTMVAFVGYVNSLVVESGILRQLPNAIFSQEGMLDANQETINEIAAEEEGEAKQREEDKRNLNTLRRILKILEEGLK